MEENERPAVAKALIIILAILLVVVMIVGGVTIFNAPDNRIPAIPIIKSAEMPNYVGQRVAINLTPAGETDENGFPYYYKVYSMCGKISCIIKTSIYSNYRVYNTEERIKIAVTKETELSKRSMIVVGTVKKDDYTPGNMALFAIETIQ